MPSISELLETAAQLHRGGNLEPARALYEQVLDADPRHANALNLLGLVHCQSGQYATAVDVLRRAVACDPNQAAFFANLAEAHRGLGQLDEAIECYRQAMHVQPDTFEIHNNLGTLLQRSGRLDEAIACYQHASSIQPQNSDAHFNIATALQQQGNLREAVERYARVLRWKPDHVRAILATADILTTDGDLTSAAALYQRALELQPERASTHYNLGNVRQRQGELDAAVSCYRRALELQDDHADALCNLGNALQTLERLDEARACLERAVGLRPDSAAAQNNLGVVLQHLVRFADSQSRYERALELDPDNAVFHHNLGTARRDQADFTAALACYDRSLSLDPTYRQARCSRGSVRLALGRYADGWADYEYRVGLPRFDTLAFPQPVWDGSPLADRTLLVHCEQGLGDTLQFIRYLGLVNERGGKIVVAAPPALLPLLAQSGIAGLVSRDEPPPAFDVHVPLLSLPNIFGTEVRTVPRDVPYLAADRLRIQQWRETLSGIAGMKVGIAWQGNRGYLGDLLRSIPLAEFVPLSRIPGVQLVSLQKGPGSEQVAELSGRMEIVDLHGALDKAGGAFLDTAAVIENLDLVITSDTAIAHLAGALGARVWVALTRVPDWRWLLDREDSPWYPSIRLFRQTTMGDWSEVFGRIASALARLAEDARS